jgi:hypothetical protein
MSSEKDVKDDGRPPVAELGLQVAASGDYVQTLDRDAAALAALGREAQLERRFTLVSLCGAAFAGGIPSWTAVIPSLILIVNSAGKCVLLNVWNASS